MKRALLALVLGASLLAAGFAVAAWADKPPAPPGQDPCSHGNSGKPCREDPQPNHGKDCDPHGKIGGVDEDHCAAQTTTTTTTTTTTSTGTTTSTTGTTSTSPTTTQTTTFPPNDSTTISTTMGETTTTAGPTPPPSAGPSPPKKKLPPGPGMHPPETPTRMFHGKPHPIVRGSG